MTPLAYKQGYRYQVHDDYMVNVGISGYEITLDKYLTLDGWGNLTVHQGYAWDGASGPAINTRDFIRGSLVHDALYQLMAEDLLPFSFRRHADEKLIEICRADGMGWPRWVWVKAAVRIFGARAIETNNPVLFAPEKKPEATT
jgi:hypothetical protein